MSLLVHPQSPRTTPQQRRQTKVFAWDILPIEMRNHENTKVTKNTKNSLYKTYFVRLRLLRVFVVSQWASARRGTWRAPTDRRRGAESRFPTSVRAVWRRSGRC